MRIFQILFLVIFFYGCSDTIETSDQTMQGLYNNIEFRSAASSAFIDESGFLIIEGSSSESIRLQVETPQSGVYEIVSSNDNEASFSKNSKLYITEGEDTGGRIEIDEITATSVSGSFFFDARLNGTGERLNFQKGIFFNIPFVDEDTTDPASENFKAKIDGADFNADVTQTNITNKTLTIAGTQSDVMISINLPVDLQTGNYDITPDGNQNAIYSQQGNTENAVSGSLTIDVLSDEQVSGSFTFTTENGIEITEGTFELTL